MDKNKWTMVAGCGEIPQGTREILTYRINGSLTNGCNGQPFTASDAERALNSGRDTVEYSR